METGQVQEWTKKVFAVLNHLIDECKTSSTKGNERWRVLLLEEAPTTQKSYQGAWSKVFAWRRTTRTSDKTCSHSAPLVKKKIKRRFRPRFVYSCRDNNTPLTFCSTSSSENRKVEEGRRVQGPHSHRPQGPIRLTRKYVERLNNNEVKNAAKTFSRETQKNAALSKGTFPCSLHSLPKRFLLASTVMQLSVTWVKELCSLSDSGSTFYFLCVVAFAWMDKYLWEASVVATGTAQRSTAVGLDRGARVFTVPLRFQSSHPLRRKACTPSVLNMESMHVHTRLGGGMFSVPPRQKKQHVANRCDRLHKAELWHKSRREQFLTAESRHKPDHHSSRKNIFAPIPVHCAGSSRLHRTGLGEACSVDLHETSKMLCNPCTLPTCQIKTQKTLLAPQYTEDTAQELESGDLLVFKY